MSKPRNPRRTLIENLRNVKGQTSAFISLWDVRGTVYDYSSASGNAPARARRADEFPENDPEKWDQMARAARRMAYHLTMLAEFCERERTNAVRRQGIAVPTEKTGD